MPFANSNDFTTGRKPAVTPSATDLIAVRATIDLLTSDLVLNDTGAVLVLPPGCVPVDVIVDMDDLDTGAAALVFQVGIVNAAQTDLSVAAADGGANWGATAASNTASTQRIVFNGKALVSVQPAQVERLVGLKVATAPTAAAAGQVGVTMLYRAV